MTGIPLVNTNSVNDINTSIIAIKKEMKSSGETEVNVNVNLPDTAIPVDEVTSGNMHSVTSNAVAEAMSYSTSEVNTGKKWIDGKPIYKLSGEFVGPTDGSYQIISSAINKNLVKRVIIFMANGQRADSGNTDWVLSSAPNTDFGFYLDSNGLNIWATATRRYQNICWTIEYTKTTD